MVDLPEAEVHMTSQDGDWIWSEDWFAEGRITDPAMFEDWFDQGIRDGGGPYTEKLIIGGDGRIDPYRRIDGSAAMLPMFMHQVRRTSSNDFEVITRGPNLEEFYQILSMLQVA